MKILLEQMTSLAVLMKDDFIASASAHVDRAYPEFTYRLTPAQLDTALRGFVQEAARFGLTGEQAVIRYIEYRIESQGGLIEAPEWAWAREILSDPSLGEEAKIARIDAVAYGAPLAEEEG